MTDFQIHSRHYRPNEVDLGAPLNGSLYRGVEQPEDGLALGFVKVLAVCDEVNAMVLEKPHNVRNLVEHSFVTGGSTLRG